MVSGPFDDEVDLHGSIFGSDETIDKLGEALMSTDVGSESDEQEAVHSNSMVSLTLKNITVSLCSQYL